MPSRPVSKSTAAVRRQALASGFMYAAPREGGGGPADCCICVPRESKRRCRPPDFQTRMASLEVDTFASRTEMFAYGRLLVLSRRPWPRANTARRPSPSRGLVARGLSIQAGFPSSRRPSWGGRSWQHDGNHDSSMSERASASRACRDSAAIPSTVHGPRRCTREQK